MSYVHYEIRCKHLIPLESYLLSDRKEAFLSHMMEKQFRYHVVYEESTALNNSRGNII